jgi:beta-galactosidase
MKKHLILLALFLLSVLSSQAGDRRHLLKVDTGWEFVLGDQPSLTAPMGQAGWTQVNIPHDWSIAGRPEAHQPMGNDGGYFPAGIGWYRNVFKAPASWAGRHIQLYFEGVYMNAEVFLNGRSIGVHPYGYTSFVLDLTPSLNIGETNTLVVKVDNSQQKNSRWYSGSGIYRPVWLRVTDPVHLTHWGLALTTKRLTSREATVEVEASLDNRSNKSRHVNVTINLINPNGRNVASKQVTVDVPAGDTVVVNEQLLVSKPILWSPDAPHVYEADVTITEGKRTLDRRRETFGLRTLIYSVSNGLLLNGQSIRLNGGCVHHDNGCLGAAAYDKAEERKVILLKSAGFNAVRTSHNPPSEAFLDACDKHGLLVMDEAFDGWRTAKTPHDYALLFDDWAVKDVASMVLRDRNHPSVFCWSIGNEIIERKDPQAVHTARLLKEAVKAIDPTRPVTSAMTTWDSEWERYDTLFAVHDIGGYNYQLHRATDDHKRVPDRLIIQTESYPNDAFANWSLVNEYPYILGDFVWTAMDYLGESGIGRYYYPNEKPGEHWEGNFYPWHGAYCGDIDLIGWRKPISHYRSLLYHSTERLYMAVREPNPSNGPIKLTSWAVWPTWESWTWPGMESQPLEVEVYSRHQAVRLYLNDQLMGEHPTTQNEAFKATFMVPYQPGRLKAVGVEKGREIETVFLQTAGEPTTIRLTADHQSLKADGQDLVFVEVALTDDMGVIHPTADQRLSISVEGEATLLAVGNADLTDSDAYVGNTRKAWKGRALVVIRSSRTAGQIRLTVQGDGLKTAVLNLKSTSKGVKPGWQSAW